MNTQVKQLFDTMVRHGIGLDPYFFERNAETPSFPPHNIAEVKPDNFCLTLALAGYSEDEIEIVLDQDILTIIGTKAPDDDSLINEGYRMLYRGIGMRSFTRQFKVGEHVRVAEAFLDNGMLQVNLVRELPEVLKPKRIPLSSRPATAPPKVVSPKVTRIA